jgi:NAD(P)-dependent dehydrogenase (short-subunit alcohol dehydrogenase family)
VRRARPEPRPEGRTVAIQGVGHVGAYLAEKLHAAGAKLTIADVNQTALNEVAAKTGAQIVPTDAIFDVEADVFAPCALGGAISAATLPRLKVKVIAGGANNQLADAMIGQTVFDRGILYAPDYVINGGGIINVAAEIRALEAGGPSTAAGSRPSWTAWPRPWARSSTSRSPRSARPTWSPTRSPAPASRRRAAKAEDFTRSPWAGPMPWRTGGADVHFDDLKEQLETGRRRAGFRDGGQAARPDRGHPAQRLVRDVEERLRPRTSSARRPGRWAWAPISRSCPESPKAGSRRRSPTR